MNQANSHKCVRCEKPTCEAHLLPRGFTKRVRGSGKNLAQVFKDKIGEKLSQSAIYDTGILCSECDRKIGRLDEYALDFCKRFAAKKHLLKTHFCVTNTSADNLVRFAVSIIWRCAISSRPETINIDLGTETDTFGDIIFDTEKSPIIFPQVALMRCTSRYFTDVEHFCGLPSLTPSLLAPNDKFLSFLLGGFRWIVRLDRTEWPKSLRLTSINGEPNIIGTFFDFDASHEFRDMKKWLLRNHSYKIEKMKQRTDKIIK